MAVKINMLVAQMIELLTERHRTPEHGDKSNENFANLFFGCRHKTKSTDDRRYEFGLRFDILEFQGSGQADELFGLD